MRVRAVLLICGWWLMPLVFSCQVGQDGSPDSSVATVPKKLWVIDQHWIHDEQLRQIMSRLVTDHRWPERDVEDVPCQRERKRQAFADAAALAGALEAAGERLPGMISRYNLTASDRRAFVTEANDLRDLARKLKLKANRSDLKGMERLLGRIEDTCSACHDRFRDFRQLLGPGQARGVDSGERLSSAWHLDRN